MRQGTRAHDTPARSTERRATADELDHRFPRADRSCDEELLPGGCLCCAAGMDCDRHTLAKLVETPAVELPMRAQLEHAFGRSLGSVRAHLGERRALARIGARAAAEGDTIAFSERTPSVETVAHEVAHVLQARRATGNDEPEQEARAVAAQVARGEQPAAIESHATGVLHADDEDPIVDAENYWVRLAPYFILTLGVVESPGLIAAAPFGTYVSPEREFARAIYHQLENLDAGGLENIIAPESLSAIVDVARRHRLVEQEGPDGKKVVVQSNLGSAQLETAATIGVQNAFFRRFFESMQRMVPRYVAEAWRLDPRPIQIPPLPFGGLKPGVNELPITHPLDRVVAKALCDPRVWVADRDFARDHYDLVPRPHAAPIPVTLEFAPQGLWHWVRATPANASAEDVAKALFDSPDQAYRLVPMPPLWGFHAADINAFKRELIDDLDALAWHGHPNPALLNQADLAAYEAAQKAHYDEWQSFNSGMPDPEREPWSIERAPVAHYGLARTEIDPMVEIQQMDVHEQYALAHVQVSPTAITHDEIEIYDRLDENLSLVDTIHTNLDSLGRSTEVIADLEVALRRRQQQAATCELPNPERQYELANQQGTLLGRIATGTSIAVATALQFGGFARIADTDGHARIKLDIGRLPEMVQAPILDVAEAYASAITAIEFPSIATPRTARADQLAQTLQITITEVSLAKADLTLEDARLSESDRQADTADYDPSKLEYELGEQLEALRDTRVRMLANMPDAQAGLSDILAKASDLQFEVAIIGQLEMLDSLWKTIDDEHDFWESFADDIDGIRLQLENREFYRQFRDEVFAVYMQGVAKKNETRKQQAKTRFGELTAADSPFTRHFDAVNSHLKDEASHKKWAKIIAAVAIAVVAFGLGQWAGAVWAAEVIDFGSVVVSAAVETGVGLGLNYAVLDQKPTVGSVVTGFGGSIALVKVFGMAGKLARTAGELEAVERAAAGVSEQAVGELAKLSRSERLGAAAAKFGKQAFLAQAIGLTMAEAQSLIDHREFVSADELPNMFVQNLITSIAMHVAQRPVEESIQRWRNKQIGVDFEGLAAERDTLKKLAMELQQAPDPAKAQDLIAREQLYEARERAAMEQLATTAKLRPGLFPEGEAARIVAALDAHDVAAANLARMQALTALEEIGPGYYRADRRAVDALLGEQQRSGGRILKVETNPTTGLRTITVQPEVGPPIRIKEKLQGPPGTRTIPVDEAQRFEAWLENDPIGTDPEASEVYRTRLRELYARDPQAAVSAGERLGYETDHPIAAHDPLQDPARAFEHYEFQRAGDPPESTTTNQPLDRADFEAMYRGGYDYDPVAREFRPRPGAMRAGSTGMIPRSGVGGVTHFVGAVPSEAVGLQVMRKLAAGEAEALRVAGVEPPAGFDSRATEWGLGRRSDGSIVLIRGGAGEVNWDAIPDVEPIAHSHPLRDPITGALREVVGTRPDRTISADLTDATQTDLVYFTPSSSDVEHVVRTGKPHVVHTPFVYLGEGRIGNPGPGVRGDTVDIVIDSAERVGVFSEDSPIVIYRARIRLMAGDITISPGDLDLFQGLHPYMGDMPSLRPPDTLFVLPPEIPATGPMRTSAGAAMSSDPAAQQAEVAALRIDMATTLGIAPERINLSIAFELDHVSVRPPSAPGGSYEVHAPPGASRRAIETAIERHIERARQRPRDVKADPYYTDDRGVKRRWTGTQEAEYLGRPAADPGDWWALDRGKLKYVRGDVDASTKRVYDETLGRLVPDTGAREKPRFSDGTTKQDAFEILKGQPGFGEWVTKCKEVLGVSEAELIARMGDPSGLLYDTIRHNLKGPITKELVARISDRAFLEGKHPELYAGGTEAPQLRVADQIASHRELLRLTDGLWPSDRGSIAEQWYATMYASDKAVRHVEFTGKETTPNIVFDEGVTKRVPDLIDGEQRNRLKDIKHVSGALGDDVKIQLGDFRKLVGPKLTVGSTLYTFETLTVVFTEPSGVRANADYIAEMVDNDPKFAFEIFNSEGQRLQISSDDMLTSSFNATGDRAGLALAIRRWAQ